MSSTSIAETITVVGGGWSAKALDLNALPGFVIGANEAGVRIRCDAAVSMDRLFTENRWAQLKARAIPFYARKAALVNVLERPIWLNPFDCDYKSTKFRDEPGFLNGTNSGFCALNLAYQRRPSTIFLVGFDMNRDPSTGHPYWHEPHPWANPAGGTGTGRYNLWAKEMADAAAAFRAIGCSVYNVSLTSSITDFPKISPAQFRKIQETK